MRGVVRTVAAVLLSVVLFSTEPTPAAHARQSPRAGLTPRTLGAIEELRAAFNDDRGKLRILLLLSPT